MGKAIAVFGASCLLIFSLAGATKTATSDAKSFGAPSAPITLDVFSDYQCPACRELYLRTLKQVMTDYVSTGKVYLVDHDFPLPMHAYGRKAAEYANAAVQIHKFETVSNELFQKQAIWAADGNIDAVLSPILTPGEMTKLRQGLKDPAIAQSIANDVALGTKVGLTQTPTMVVTHNGRKYPMSGVISYAILKRFLDDLASH